MYPMRAVGGFTCFTDAERTDRLRFQPGHTEP